MNLTRRLALFAAAASAAAVFLTLPVTAAGVTVNVSLWDKGTTSMDMMGKMPAMGMGMMGGDMAMATMGITVDQATVPAGEVTFAVTNASKDLIHEMILSPVTDTAVALPYIADEQRVDEDASGHIGEVAELDIGAKGALTVTLQPGTYILYSTFRAIT